MKIKDIINFLEDLMNTTDKKSEKAFYKKFSLILFSLEKKGLDKEKVILIENKLEKLDLKVINEKRVKYLKWKLTQFTQFLEEEFSFIESWHYVSLGIVFWMMIGLAIATFSWFEFGMGSETTGGLISGMLVGIVVGSFMDAKAEKDNRVLKNK
jgi:hypothetical protein